MVSLGALAAGFAVAYAFHARLIELLNQALPPGRRHPVTLGVAEPFMTSIKISLFAGFALALPVILWQAWSFFAPALAEGTQRVLGWFVVVSTVLFAVGLAFAYRRRVAGGGAFPDELRLEPLRHPGARASSYYSFALLVLFAVGLVFELPVFVLGLVRLRVTQLGEAAAQSADRLRRGRGCSRLRCPASTRSRRPSRWCRCSSSTSRRSGSP